MKACECMARLVCHASRLKCDDVSLKGQDLSIRTCSNRNSYASETLRHVLMQCPLNQEDFGSMIDDICKECPNIALLFQNEPSEIFCWILGKQVPGIDVDELTAMRVIAAIRICMIYSKVLSTREGIG